MRYLLAVVFLAMLAPNAFCKGGTLSFSAGSGIMRGDTTYQIGGDYQTPDGSGKVRFPMSELKFPLEVYYGSLAGKLELGSRLEVAVGFKKNLSKDSGTMKDRDWGILYDGDWWTDPDSLDISSVSDLRLDAVSAEVSARIYAAPWRFGKTELTAYAGGRYTYQKFDFTASNLHQWYPSRNDYYGFDVGGENIPGTVLTYEVTKHIPAVLAGVKLTTTPRLTFDIAFGYAPLVTVEDEDRHLLRSIVSRAECDGEAVSFSFTGQIMLFSRWSLNIAYDYTTIDTEGTETQYQDGGHIGTIEQKNFSDVHMSEISLLYRF